MLPHASWIVTNHAGCIWILVAELQKDGWLRTLRECLQVLPGSIYLSIPELVLHMSLEQSIKVSDSFCLHLVSLIVENFTNKCQFWHQKYLLPGIIYLVFFFLSRGTPGIILDRWKVSSKAHLSCSKTTTVHHPTWDSTKSWAVANTQS